jgi:hypothetical protein
LSNAKQFWSGESYRGLWRRSFDALSSTLVKSGVRSGITILGADVNDLTAGQSVSGAGDVNGDGFDDLIIGAVFGDASA